MTAKEFLKEINKIEKLIQNKNKEVERWKSISVSTSPNLTPDKVQITRRPQKMAEAVETYVDIEKEILDLTNKYKKFMSILERLNTVEYDILHKIYIQNNSIAEIAVNYNRSYSWAVKKHKQALKHLQEEIKAFDFD